MLFTATMAKKSTVHKVGRKWCLANTDVIINTKIKFSLSLSGERAKVNLNSD
jgi:hypothetical protein